jgi:hypothetical protein
MNERHSAAMREVREAEAAGEVADSIDVRKELVRRMHAGEITLEQGQAELARLKKGAKAKGLQTRSSVYRDGRTRSRA